MAKFIVFKSENSRNNELSNETSVYITYIRYIVYLVGAYYNYILFADWLNSIIFNIRR